MAQAQPQTTGYKFLTSDMKSMSDHCCKWVAGEWKRHEGPLEMCRSGFHYWKEPLDAFRYVYDNSMRMVDDAILTMVEAGDTEITEGHKTVAREMRVKRVLDTKWIAVQFAVACARRSFPAYEKAYPDDDSIRLAIEAAETWLKDPSEMNRSAAWSSARRAWSAAWHAFRHAEPVIWSASWSAARCAESAGKSVLKFTAWSAASCAEFAIWPLREGTLVSAERKWQNMTLKSIIRES